MALNLIWWLCLLFLAVLAAPGPAAALYNGTPSGVPTSFDCKVRELAWQYGKKLAPQRGSFKSLFDALQLGGCSVSNPPTVDDVWAPPRIQIPTIAEGSNGYIIYVDSELGDDRHRDPSSPETPLRTLQAAVSISRSIVAAVSGPAPPRHIVVRGEHYLAEPLHLGAQDSGLHLQNADGLPATLTGAKKLTTLSWQQYKPPPKPPKPQPPPHTASFLPNENNVFGVAKAGGKGDPPDLSFLGIIKTPQLCASACNKTAACMSWTWHPDTPAMKDFKLNCFGRTTDFWQPKREAGIFSGQSARTPPPLAPPAPPTSINAWVADVSQQLPIGSAVYGLRVGEKRAIRARYPNADPETASSFPPWVDNGYGGMRANHGYLPWKGGTAKWTPQVENGESTDFLSGPADWPGVEWPSTPIGKNAAQTGTGNWGMFTMGTGGPW